MARPWIPEPLGLNALTGDLARIAVRAPVVVAQVTEISAARITADWRATWTRGPKSRIKRLPKSISYEMEWGPWGIEAEIGSSVTPRKGKNQGSIAHWIEYGTVNNAPIPGGGPALRSELPKYMAALAVALKKLV